LNEISLGEIQFFGNNLTGFVIISQNHELISYPKMRAVEIGLFDQASEGNFHMGFQRRSAQSVLLLALPVILALLLAACAPAPQPSRVVPSSAPATASTLPTGAPTRPVPVPSPAELFDQMSRTWRVAFVDAVSRKVCFMDGDGSNQSCLDYQDYDYPNGYRRKLGCWSPDGSWFATDRNDDTGIFIWEAGGGLTTFQESGEGLVFRQPFCSSDGKYIAYQIEPVAGWNIPAEVPGTYIESLDRSYKLRISSDNVSVDWSPDGQSLLFSGADIYTASANGTNPSRLTQNTAGYLYPTWSPDGRQIAFLRRDGSRNALYIMNADGSGIHLVASLEYSNTYSMFNYTWLPTGKYILYNDQLIDVETGAASRLSFSFDPTSAVWFTHPIGAGIATPIPSE
jgi:hypothetical protein